MLPLHRVCQTCDAATEQWDVCQVAGTRAIAWGHVIWPHCREHVPVLHGIHAVCDVHTAVYIHMTMYTMQYTFSDDIHVELCMTDMMSGVHVLRDVCRCVCAGRAELDARRRAA